MCQHFITNKTAAPNFCGAIFSSTEPMEAGNHFKNGASPKSQMSRGIIKKVAIAAIALSMGITANAQEKGDMAVGAHIRYGVNVKVDGGTEIDEPNFGFGAKFRYSPLNRLRLEGAFTYLLPTVYTEQERRGIYDYNYKYTYNKWSFEACVHYLVGSEKFTFYPTVGLVTVGRKFTEKADQFDRQGKLIDSAKESESHIGIGMNAGAGFEVKVANNIFLNAELKFQIATTTQDFLDLTETLTLTWLSTGVVFKF